MAGRSVRPPFRTVCTMPNRKLLSQPSLVNEFPGLQNWQKSQATSLWEYRHVKPIKLDSDALVASGENAGNAVSVRKFSHSNYKTVKDGIAIVPVVQQWDIRSVTSTSIADLIVPESSRLPFVLRTARDDPQFDSKSKGFQGYQRSGRGTYR